jgi:HPt (histidine-containing phosphotransfer) domain-containing protein
MPPIAMSDAPPSRRALFSIRVLRRLVLVVLTVSVLAFTAGVFGMVRQIFDNFGPAVRTDLYWTAHRGAQDLARTADIGLAVGDPAIVTSAFGDYRTLGDVVAIAAIDGKGATVAVHGTPPEPIPSLFSGPPTAVRATPGYLVAWAPAAIEGSMVGKVAIALSTRRIVQSERLLRQISFGTGIAGAVALLFGTLFINFFTRSIVARDQQLAAYASGLENKVAERTAELDRMNRGMRLVLDNVDQGFLIIARDGTMSPERSAIVDRWFGAAAPHDRLPDYLRSVDAQAAEWLTLGLDSLAEGFMPPALVLDQLPSRMTCGQRTLSLAYVPISTPVMLADAGDFDRLLVVITDITDELERARMEHDNQEMIQIFKRASTDRVGTNTFFAEAEQVVQQLAAGRTTEVEKRLVHTLKGNCAMFGIDSMVQLCHEAESRLQQGDGVLLDADRRSLRARWEQVILLARGLLGEERKTTFELTPGDLDGLLDAVKRGAPRDQIVGIAESWRHELVAVRFARLADGAAQVAKRLGKPPVAVHCEASGLRLDPLRWAPFWSAVVHAVNNAVDHGIESAEARAAAGKPAAGTIWLNASPQGGDLVISVRDDGRGVDWDRVAERARALGRPHATRGELAAALFVDGLSTKTEATSTSGRGVGLGALAEATKALGGRVDVISHPGSGTTLFCRFPGVSTVSEAAVQSPRAQA